MLPLPPINQAEATLCVLGLRPFISKEVERVHKYHLDEIGDLPKKIRKLARDLVNDELEGGFRSDFNYKASLLDLAAGWDVHQVEAMVAQFPPHSQVVGTSVVILASQTVQKLLAMLPKSEWATLTGVKNLLPSDIKLWKFVNVLEVLDDPLTLFPLMATGALLRSQAAAVRAVFPTISAAIDQAILEETIRAKHLKKSFELAPYAEIGVKAWLGRGPIDPKLLRRAQERAQNQPPQGNPRASGPSAAAMAEGTKPGARL